MDVYIGGKRVRINPDDPATHKGKGGEADIIDIGNGQVIKLYKQPNHPDLIHDATQQQLAAIHLQELQKKLPDFPTNLPGRVVVPTALAYNAKGVVIGYTMPFLANAEMLLMYAKQAFRKQGVSQAMMVRILQDAYRTVQALHGRQVIIGDFKYENILIDGEQAYFIDADSFQFGPYWCRAYTPRFLDPLLCKPGEVRPILQKPYNALSDWYSFAAILLECLLFVGPYGGIYTPKNPRQQLTSDERIMKRVNIFRSDVIYPKKAIHYRVLPDDLLHWLEAEFSKDSREVLPEPLLDMSWKICSNCQTEHARPICPTCALVPAGAVKQTLTVRGQVTATRIFKTVGTVVYATVENGRLKWLSHDGRRFLREDNTEVAVGELDPFMRFRIQGERTLIARDHTVLIFKSGLKPEQLAVDRYRFVPLFDVTPTQHFWVAGGHLLRESAFAPDRIGDVVAGHSLFWVGPEFGFGFYRPGNRVFGFVFKTQGMGINDNVTMPEFKGAITEAHCIFGTDRAWCFLAAQEHGNTVNRCIVVDSRGTTLATAEALEGDASWLSTLGGACAIGQFILVPTDKGVVRIEIVNGRCEVTKEFPDTEPFVKAGDTLQAATDGLYVISNQSITKLTIR